MDNTVTLYRVEDEAGRGPFARGTLGDILTELFEEGYTATTDPHDMPGQTTDPYLGHILDRLCAERAHKLYRYAFETLEALLEVFQDRKVRERLEARGFKLSIYRAPREHVLTTPAQSLFKAEAAERLERKPLPDHEVDPVNFFERRAALVDAAYGLGLAA